MARVSCIILLICVWGISVCDVSGKQLPSFVQKCKLNSPGLNDCMKKTIMDFRKYLKSGVKEMKLPSLDPHVLPQVTMETSWMNGTMTQLKTYNANNFNLEYFNMDLDQGFIELNLTVPYMEMTSHYEMDGRVLQFTLHGEGEMVTKVNDTKARITLHGKKIQKKGHEYFNLTDIDYKLIEQPKAYTHLGDLFRNNPEITERVNQVIQENQDSLFKEFYPIVEKIVASIDLSLFKAVFDNYSLQELFD